MNEPTIFEAAAAARHSLFVGVVEDISKFWGLQCAAPAQVAYWWCGPPPALQRKPEKKTDKPKRLTTDGLKFSTYCKEAAPFWCINEAMHGRCVRINEVRTLEVFTRFQQRRQRRIDSAQRKMGLR